MVGRGRWVPIVLLAGMSLAGCVGVEENASTGTPTQDSLVLRNPDVSLQGYKIYDEEDLRDDPRAQSPDYIYVQTPEEAVKVAGPDVEFAAIRDAQAVFREEGEFEVVEGRYPEGYWVRFGERLEFWVQIGDWEREIELARVSLVRNGRTIETEFVFAATGSGVAHEVILSGFIEGDPAGKAGPFDIEAR